jgi:hypothetical protein
MPMHNATAHKLGQFVALVTAEVKFRKRVGTSSAERLIADDILAEVDAPNLDRQIRVLQRRAATRRRQAAVKAGALGRGFP